LGIRRGVVKKTRLAIVFVCQIKKHDPDFGVKEPRSEN
jgi:hypothetical protein